MAVGSKSRDWRRAIPLVLLVILAGSLTLIWWVWWKNAPSNGGHFAVLAWTEDNQGLISTVALLFALSWALWENHRANTEEERELSAFKSAIVDLIDRSLEDLSNLEGAQTKFPGNDDFF